MKTLIKVLLLVLFPNFTFSIFAQEDTLEVFIIDAFVTPEKPHTFKLSFFTTEEVETNVLIDNNYKVDVSKTPLEDHSVEIDFTSFKFTNKFIPYKILAVNSEGIKSESEQFELILPYEQFIETKEGDNPITTLLSGLFLYLLPSPNYLMTEFDEYFSLTKEFPLITFYSSGYNYPAGNISLEYTHIYDDDVNNIMRLGYKHIIPVDFIEYISPGLTGFTNFNGFNGVGAELSIGLFNFYDVFTFYSRYRYNVKPTDTNQYFHEVSIGFYSHFFTIDI